MVTQANECPACTCACEDCTCWSNSYGCEECGCTVSRRALSGRTRQALGID